MPCMRSILLLMLSLVYSNVGDTVANSKIGEIFSYEVNGLSFGPLSQLKKHTSPEVVSHMEIDLQDGDSIIYSAGPNLYKLEWNSDEDPMSTRLTEDDSFITTEYQSFAQMDKDKILIVDSYRHCLVLFNRGKCEKPQALNNICGGPGHRDGPIHQALFKNLNKIVRDPVAKTFYVTESSHIRKIEFDYIDTVSTVLRHDRTAILGLAIDFTLNRGYYTTRNGLHKFTLESPGLNIRHLSKGEFIGHADGPLLKSQFNMPSHITLLNSKTLMISDRNNKRYRIVDLTLNVVSSICNIKPKKPYPTVTGNISECGLHQPAAQLHLPHRSIILVTDGRAILRLEVTDLWRHRIKLLLVVIVTLFSGMALSIKLWRCWRPLAPFGRQESVTQIVQAADEDTDGGEI